MTKDELIARLEAATGPDRELDAAIFAAIYPDKVPAPIVGSGYGWRFTGQLWWLETGEDSRCPRETIAPMSYTASIDAALTLVPEGYSVEIGIYIEGEKTHKTGSFARVSTYCMGDGPGWEIDAEKGATPALALAIAALKARP